MIHNEQCCKRYSRLSIKLLSKNLSEDYKGRRIVKKYQNCGPRSHLYYLIEYQDNKTYIYTYRVRCRGNKI